MDYQDLADQKMKEAILKMLCPSCRAQRPLNICLDSVFNRAREARKKLEECEKRLLENYKEGGTEVPSSMKR